MTDLSLKLPSKSFISSSEIFTKTGRRAEAAHYANLTVGKSPCSVNNDYLTSDIAREEIPQYSKVFSFLGYNDEVYNGTSEIRYQRIVDTEGMYRNRETSAVGIRPIIKYSSIADSCVSKKNK